MEGGIEADFFEELENEAERCKFKELQKSEVEKLNKGIDKKLSAIKQQKQQLKTEQQALDSQT